MIDFLTVFLSTLFYKQKQPSTDAVIKWCKNRLQIAAKPKKQRRDQQTVGPTRWLIEGIGASLMNVRRWWWGFILKKYKMARNKTRLPGYQVVHMLTRHNIAWYRSKPYENAIHRVQNKCLKKNKQKTSIIRYEKCFFQMHRCTVKPFFSLRVCQRVHSCIFDVCFEEKNWISALFWTNKWGGSFCEFLATSFATFYHTLPWQKIHPKNSDCVSFKVWLNCKNSSGPTAF